MSDLWDEDDDDILELGNRPPIGQVAEPTQMSDTSDEVLRARGEVSVLRQKLGMLEKTLTEHDEKQRKVQAELKALHEDEIRKLKIELERLEDERKFMILEQKHLFTPRNSSKSASTTDTSVSDVSPLPIKKRKVEASKDMVTVGQNFKSQDDSSLFFDSLISFRLPGANHTVFEALYHISTYKTDVELGTGAEKQVVKARSPLGPPLRSLFFRWKSVFSLDQLVDKTLETLAIVIKAVSNPQETKFVVPFLISLMHATINFRHSATSINSLKDIFQFITDFIISNPKFLKQPLFKNPLELDVAPDVFQYSMLDQLCLRYSFDVLETCINILHNCSDGDKAAFLTDDIIIENLSKCCNLSLSISYRPVLPIIVSTTELLLSLVDLYPPELQWKSKWVTLSSKLIQNWETPLVYDSEKLNFSGLNRCCGDNGNCYMLDNIVNFSEVRHLPVIIQNNFTQLTEAGQENEAFWITHLKTNIAVIMHKLLQQYQSSICSVDFLQKTFSLFSHQHETLLTECLCDDSVKGIKTQNLLSTLLRLIYFCWTSITEELKRSLHVDELTISLWRIVYGSPESFDDITEEWASLMKPLETLSLEEMRNLDDAFDTDNVPSFMSYEQTELLKDAAVSKFTINNSWAFKEVARFILESITTMDEADSLYVAMVGDI